MGTKDRTLRANASESSKRAAIRQGGIRSAGNDDKLSYILYVLQLEDRARVHESKRPGPPVRLDVPMRLARFLDDQGLSTNTYESSATVEKAAEALNLSPGRVVEIMHQLNGLARDWRPLQ